MHTQAIYVPMRELWSRNDSGWYLLDLLLSLDDTRTTRNRTYFSHSLQNYSNCCVDVCIVRNIEQELLTNI